MSSPVPARIGRYEVEAELGHGAMGVVYRARDPRLGRVVALKTLLVQAGMDADAAHEMKARFLNEGRAAGRLHHPGIVSVFDADEDPATGIAYLAMEFVDGGDLRSFLPGMPAEDLVRLLAQVAEALDHAHERGVVHRDVKPANILVDPKGRAKLTDFGIARLGDSTMTHAGQLVGSPAYMSPEQVRAQPVTAASDIFSLGVVLYEGLTGRKPFMGQDMVSTTHAIVNEQHERPSHVSPGLGRAVDAVLQRALAKRPADRYATATALAEAAAAALSKAAAAAPRSATGAAPGAAPAAAAPRRGPLVGVSVAVALAVVALVAFLVVRRGDKPAPQAASIAPAATAASRPAAPIEPSAPSIAASPHATSAPKRQEPRAPAVAAPVPAAKASAPAVARSSVDVELHTLHAGTLVILAGDEEIGRRSVGNVSKGGIKLRNPKFEFRDQFPVKAGRQILTFVFLKRGGGELRQRAVQVVPTDHPLVAKVDIGTLGRDIDLRFE